MRLTFVLCMWVLVAAAACGGDIDGPENMLVADDAGIDDEPSEPPPENLCAAFVERVCGPGGTTCLDSGACQAALLIDTYERGRCADGFADACTRLVDKVCGEQQACVDSGGCQQAMSLDAQLKDVGADDDDRNDARDACAAGLVDDLVFAPCD
jgi:hypothetical protein